MHTHVLGSLAQKYREEQVFRDADGEEAPCQEAVRELSSGWRGRGWGNRVQNKGKEKGGGTYIL